LDEDPREWDAHLPEIEVAIRNTVHSATGEAPFLTVYGHHMFFNGSSYKLARRLRSLVEHEMAGMQTKEKLRVIHAKVQKQLEGAYQTSRQRYYKRANKANKSSAATSC